jgi:MFS family permease
MEAPVTKTNANARKTAVASLVGTCIEWYDFYIYGTASALVFSALFFPSYDPTVGTLLAFGTFALGAIMRPLGGLVCGHYGDRVGRKSMLVMTLVGMGAVTFLIGLLPTYSQIGVLAPILLIILRMLQGFAFGGEWGGAVLPPDGVPDRAVPLDWNVRLAGPHAQGRLHVLGLAHPIPVERHPCRRRPRSASPAPGVPRICETFEH